MPRRHRAGLPLVCATLLAFAGARGAQAKVQAVIVQWGEIEVGEAAGPLGPEYDEHSLGAGHEVTSQRFVNNDDHIPAQLCRSFGFRAWLASGPGEALPERILMRVTHPALTRPDGVSSAEDTLMLPVTSEGTGTSFGFDDPWEVKAGNWTFDLMLAGQVLASKTFVVDEPAPGAPRPVCPGRAVS